MRKYLDWNYPGGNLVQTYGAQIKSPQDQGSMYLITPSRKVNAVLSDGKLTFQIIKWIKICVC